MKLKNKKTGEIKEVQPITIGGFRSLAELNDEWEDYEEPKTPYFINWFGEVSELSGHISNIEIEKLRKIGNYFLSREEAERAAERMKAWKRLREFGFRFIDWELDMKTVADGKIWFDIGVNTEWDAERLLELKPEVKESLDILFGGEKW